MTQSLQYLGYNPASLDKQWDLTRLWEVRRLKFVVEICNEKRGFVSGETVYIGLENIESKTGRLMLDEPITEVDSTVISFKKGDLLYGKLRPYLAKAMIAEFDGVCTTELLVLRPRQANVRFLQYVFLSDPFTQLVDASTYGAKMPRANWDFIGNIPVLLPPPVEQAAIVDLLDRELAQIDDLIHSIVGFGRQEVNNEKGMTILSLLNERRAALIAAVVTGQIAVRDTSSTQFHESH